MDDTTFNYWYGRDTRKKEWNRDSRQLAKLALDTLEKLINKGNT